MKKRLQYLFPLIGIALILIILVVLIFLSTTVSSAIMEQAVADNKEMTDQRADVISSVIEKNGDEIDRFLSFADTGFHYFQDRYDAFTVATVLSSKMSCRKLIYFLKDGPSYNADGTIYENTDSVLSSLVQSGTSAVSSVFYDENLGENVLLIYSVYPQGETVTAAAGYYPASEIYSQCRFTDDLGTEFYFADKNGNILFSPETANSDKNIKSVLQRFNFPVDEVDLFLGDVSTKKTVTYTNDNDDGRTVVGASPIGNKGEFYAFSVTPTTVAVSSLVSAVNSSIVVSAVILFVFVLVLVYLRLTERKYKRRLSIAENEDKIAHCNNQFRFEEAADRLLRERVSTRYAMLYINIRNFKYANRVYGFQAANEIVACLSAAIKQRLHMDETYGRLVDGRLVVLVSYLDKNEIVARFEALCKDVEDFKSSDGAQLVPKLSAGIYCIDRDEKFSVAEMIDFSVFAQQSIPEDSREKYAYYTQKNRDELLRAAKIEEAMESALANGEFEMYLQPKYNIQSNCLDGAEALARWTKSDMGIITPDKFISQFERSGFITDLDRFMLEETCRLLQQQSKEGRKSVPISVNVSRVSIRRSDFLEYYINMKNSYGIANGLLELEFTENIALENYEFLKGQIEELRKNGFLCTIDDFGSGYSSFKALKELPFDCLKLDKFFLKKSDNEERDKLMISGVIALAKCLDLHVVTEGVETEKELAMLRSLKCDSIQGYLYAKPMPLIDYRFFVDKANANKIRPGQSSEALSAAGNSPQ